MVLINVSKITCKTNFINEKSIFFSIDDLSHKQNATQLHTSLGTIYNASNAVDRDPSTCMRTLPIGRNSNKTVWWKVDLGGVHSIYKINIVFKDYNGSDTNGKDMFRIAMPEKL